MLTTMTLLDDPRRYLHRLGYDHAPAPTLATLRELQARHTAAFPFETISTLLRLSVAVDLPSIEHKLLHTGRGGYCFELNRAYLELLRHLGFQARGLTGRVVMEGPAGVVPARTHMLVLVTLEAVHYISDVGFGGMVPTAPLRLDSEEEQPTPHEPYRIAMLGDGYRLSANVAGQWRALYQFDLHPQEEIDYVVANWYVCTHPDSSFLGQLRVARTGPGWRRTLGNGRFNLHRPGQPSQSRHLANADEVIEVLEREFDLRVPDTPYLRRSIADWLHASAPDIA